MDDAFFVQLALSAAAVGALVALAAWAKIAKPAGPLDEQKARALLAEEFPTRTIDAVWVASDGAGALARSGGMALVICQVGDGFAARQIPWAQAISATFRNGRLSIDLSDIAAPKAVIALPSWPPKNLTKDLAA
jgi:hypothetical protein